MNAPEQHGHPAVHFTIDGRPFTTTDLDPTVLELLRLAGLDPSGYDLGEVLPGQPEPRVFEDEQQLHLHGGERFVSIRERAEVA
jgi:hypothetical protein